MRKLQTKDIFSAMRLIRKANLREEIKPIIIMAANKEIKTEDVGVEAVLTIIETFVEKKAENEIYNFLAGPFEIPAEEISDMDMMEFIEKLGELAKESDIKAFFTTLSSMMTVKSST